jgi:hypothetical protein
VGVEREWVMSGCRADEERGWVMSGWRLGEEWMARG